MNGMASAMANSSVNFPKGRDGEMATYKGRVEFEKASNDLVGRWIWGRDSTAIKAMPKMNTKTVASEVVTASGTVSNAAPVAETAPQAGDKVDTGIPEAEKSGDTHWVLIGDAHYGYYACHCLQQQGEDRKREDACHACRIQPTSR